MKCNHFRFGLLVFLVFLIGAGIYAQEARSAGSSLVQATSLSDVDLGQFNQTGASLYQELNTRDAHSVDIDLTDGAGYRENEGNLKTSRFHKESKLQILGGRAAFPL